MMGKLALLTGWDYALILIFLMSFGIGAFRGMVRTVFDLGSWVIAFVASPLLGPIISETLGLQAQPWLGLVLGFVAAFFVTRLLGVVVAKGLITVGLAGADRALGGLIGLVRALIIVAIVATVGKLLDLDKTPAWQSALSYDVLEILTSTVETYVPDLRKLKSAAEAG